MKNEGREFDLWVRSKAPFDEFGHMLGKGPYEGDGKNTTFNPSTEDTARVIFRTSVDTENKTIDNTIAYSSGTKDMSTGEEGKAVTTHNENYNKDTDEVSFDYHASNPLVHPAPDIDVEGNLKFINKENGNLHIQGTLNGDGFPATEAFLHFDGSKAHGVMLGSSPIEKGTNKDTGPIQLIDLNLPLMQKEIMNINLSIGFEGKTPVSVTDLNTNTTYSVESWNAMHAGKPMVDCFENVDNHVSTPSVKECINDAVQFQPSENTAEALFIFDKGIMVGGDYTKNIEDIQVKQTEVDQANTFDSTIAAQETLADLNLTDFSQSNENAYAMEMD